MTADPDRFDDPDSIAHLASVLGHHLSRIYDVLQSIADRLGDLNERNNRS